MIFRFLEKVREKIRAWAIAHAQKPYATFWLSAMSFAEASFFPLPPDIMLIAMLLSGRAGQWFRLAFITSLFSVLGGLFGYAIGYFFFDAFGGAIISFYGLEEQFAQMKEVFSGAAFLTIFAAAFTPIPYKVFTIAAGLFNVPLGVFLAASVLGRGIRFFAVAYMLKLFGRQVADVLYRRFNLISLLVVGVLALAILIRKFLL